MIEKKRRCAAFAVCGSFCTLEAALDAARALRGQVFYFDRNDATLPAGRWYVADLIGCEVRDADTGKAYGCLLYTSPSPRD